MPLESQPPTVSEQIWIAFIFGQHDEVVRLMDAENDRLLAAVGIERGQT